MSAMYGRLTGARGETTRTGSDQMQATIQTWRHAYTLTVWKDGSLRLEAHEPQPEGRHQAGNVLLHSAPDHGEGVDA